MSARWLGAVCRAGVIAAALGALGCGSDRMFAPAAEPPDAPAPSVRPAGKVVPVGKEPEGLVADRRTGIVAVGLRNPDRLALLDRSTGRVVRRVELSESPRHLALAPGRMLVPAERSNELVEVRLPGGATRTVEVGEFPHDAVESEGRIFVGDEFGDTISVVEGGRVVRTLDAPVQPGGLAATPRGKVVVVAVAERVVGGFDAHTLEPAGTAEGGVGPTHVVSDCNRGAYVADTEGEAVLHYSFDPELRLAETVELPGGPYGIAVDCERRVLWVTLPGHNRLLALGIPRAGGLARRLASLPTARQPNSVAADPRSGRVFVAGRDDGTVQILRPRVGER